MTFNRGGFNVDRRLCGRTMVRRTLGLILATPCDNEAQHSTGGNYR